MANAIGIDIGGTNLRAARVSSAGEILAHVSRPTPSTAPDALALIDDLILLLADANCAAIGVGVASRVNARTGEVHSGGYVNLAGPPLGQRLKAAGRRRVVADNDANMALVAEATIGAGRGVANLVLLTIGTGIGGAARVDGAALHGAGTAGHLGHITVDINGAPCVCGRIGCLETISSGTALQRYIAQAGLPATTRCDDLLQRDDDVSRSILARWAGPLRAGIDSLAATLDPELVLLGGGLGGEAFRALQRFPPMSKWYQVRVAPAALGDSAGVIGAALAALKASA